MTALVLMGYGRRACQWVWPGWSEWATLEALEEDPEKE